MSRHRSPKTSAPKTSAPKNKGPKVTYKQLPPATAPPAGPLAIDTTKPSIARAYDAVLGGKDNYEVDRAVAAELAKVMPEIGHLAWYNRAILGRGVRYLAAAA